MKIIIFTILPLWLVSITVALTVDEILDKMEKNQKPKSQRAEITQRVFSVSGSENVSKLVSYGKDAGDKGLMEYLTPARIKGMKMLMLNEGDDIWFYSPRTARVRKIASHQRKQSVNGSDFSYEDFSAKDMREDYDSKLAGEETLDGRACYKIVSTAKSGDKTYSRSVFWVDKERFIPLKADFYDEDKALWKTLTMSGVEKVGAYWTARTVTMKNVQKGSRTVMEMDKVEFDVPMKDELFSERNLKK